MIRIVVLLLLLTGCTIFAAHENIHPALLGFPRCTAENHGFWNVYETKEGSVYLYLSTRDVKYLNPAYIVCWVDPDQQIYMGSTRKQKELTHWNSSKRTSIFLTQAP